MNAACSRILDEMMVFADLGTDGAKGEKTREGFAVRLFRNGDELGLVFADDGAGMVIERCRGSKPRTHASYLALLASERFGDLRSWAATQKMLLREVLAEIDPPIRVQGEIAGSEGFLTVDKLDEFLQSAQRDEDSVQVMLIDGPAGIGKTKFIEKLALARAASYGRRPLVLHVQSRGRVLSYLQDLIAFNLQSLRLSVTFDQLPVLARHGLVTLAIDGFDELGDPNGYELAWGQLNETIDEIRGAGTLILAGRETFIGLDRLKSALPVLREERDIVHGLTLRPPSPADAESWLVEKGWQSADVDKVRPLLDDEESYALRPFFLAKLAEREIAETVLEASGTSLLSILIELMVERESQKFGDPVDRVLNAEQRRQYTHRFLCEAAQYLADDQADVIGEIPLTWLVEMAVSEGVDVDTLRLLQNRAKVMPFLTYDALPGYRRFTHSQLFNYFLSVAVIESVGKGDIPKFVRRNIFSADFLAVFVEVLRHIASSDSDRVRTFFEGAQKWVRNYQSIDRGARNLGAWIIAALPTMADIDDGKGIPRIGPMEVDETILRGTVPHTVLRRIFVNQIDLRGADLRELTFEESTLITAIVDEGTRVSSTFPTPQRIRRQNIGTVYGDDERDPSKIGEWLDAHGRLVPTDKAAPDPGSRHGRMLWLVERACRSKWFWIPGYRAVSFTKDPLWPEVVDLLRSHDLIRAIRVHPPKGRKKKRRYLFVHIKRADRLLANDPTDKKIAEFYEAVANAAR